MLSPETRSSTPRSARCTSAGRLDDKLEVGQAAHQQTTPAPGDEAAIQDRCRAVVLVGADEAYQVHALASGAKIAEVIRDGATLKRLAAAPGASAVLGDRVADLDLILTTVSDYATAFETATKLELRLDSTDTGLQTQLAAESAALTAILAGAADLRDLRRRVAARWRRARLTSAGESRRSLGP